MPTRHYGCLVSVLELDGRAVCHYFLDVRALRHRLTGAKATRTGNPV